MTAAPHPTAPAARRKAKAANGDGGIYPRTTAAGKKVYDVSWTYKDALGVTKRGTKRGFTTRADAAGYRREVTRAVDTGAFHAHNTTLLGDYLNGWLLSARLKPQTRTGYARKVRLHVIPHLGHLQLGSVLPVHLDTLYRKLEAEGSPGGRGPLSLSTIREIHNIISSAFRALVRQVGLPVSPTSRATPPSLKQAKASSPEMNTWTANEVGHFLIQVADDHYGPLWRLIATTGMRRGEALAVHWTDVDLERGRLVIRRSLGEDRKPVEQEDGSTVLKRTLVFGPTKNDSVRVVDLDTVTIAILREHRDRQEAEAQLLGDRWVDHGLVFARGRLWLGKTATAGGPLDPERMSEAFQRACRRHGMRRIRLHELRHTWATLALENDIHPKVVQVQLGHSTSSITLDLYTHVTPSLAANATARVAAMFDTGLPHMSRVS